jgi:hypothetical protein
MNEFGKFKSWLLAAAGAAVLAAIAFIFADPADPAAVFIVAIGYLLAAAATGVGVWALLKLEPWRHLSQH